MDNQKIICTVCKQNNKQMIKAQCNHYVCVTCLKSKLTRNNIFTCSVCGLCSSLSQNINKSKQNPKLLNQMQSNRQRFDEKNKGLRVQQRIRLRRNNLDEIYNNCLKRLRHQFNALKIMVQNKQAEILNNVDRLYKQQGIKLNECQKILTEYNEMQREQSLMNRQRIFSKFQECFKRIEQIQKSESQLRIQRIQMNIKPIQGLIFGLNVNINNDQKKQIRQNEMMKQNGIKNDFSRDDSYNRIMAKLNQSRKKISDISKIKKQTKMQ